MSKFINILLSAHDIEVLKSGRARLVALLLWADLGTNLLGVRVIFVVRGLF